MEQIISMVISLVATIVSGMAVFFLKRYFKRREEREKAREQLAAEENMLILRSINAIGRSRAGCPYCGHSFDPSFARKPK